VPVDLGDGEPEGGQLVGERLERHQLLGGEVGLEAVAVDDHDQVIESLGGGDLRPLPDRSLVELPVPDHHEHPRRPAAQLGVERDPHADRQQVAERARMKLHAGQRPVRVPVEVVVDRQVLGQALTREVAALGERAVERRDVVPLRQEEIVPIRIGEARRRDAQHPLVEMDEDVRARQRRPQEATAARRHPDRVSAHPAGLLHQGLEAAHALASGWKESRSRPGRSVRS